MKPPRMLSEPAHREAVRQFIEQLVRAKNRAGELGLWLTMQALDDATTKVGYEAAAFEYEDQQSSDPMFREDPILKELKRKGGAS